MTTTLIIILICLVIAHFIDVKIRKKIYSIDIGLAQINARKNFNIKSEKFEDSMSKSWQEVVSMNNYRYGITGDFSYDIHPTDKYEVTGERTSIGTGIVLDKKHVTRDAILDDMTKFIKKKKSFVADETELRERFVVVLYVQENLQQVIWDNEGLYNNVDVGEKVAMSYNDKGPLSIGYRLKGVKDDRHTKRKLDVGKNKEVS